MSKKITAQTERYLDHIGVKGAQSPLRLTSKEGKKADKKITAQTERYLNHISPTLLCSYPTGQVR